MMDHWLDIFAAICKIPHLSGGEKPLCDYLRRTAEAAGLAARVDAKGNRAVDRPASPGLEGAPRIILQAHLDMVPQVAPGSAFDFARDPVPWRIDGDWINTGGATSLGADNGIGVALMMEILLNPGARTGPLRGLFTVEEETGLFGAQATAPEFLEGDWLINLDSEVDGVFIIGCAGGMRSGGDVALEFEAVPAGMTGVEVVVTGLKGGHSGVDIAKKRGNAIRIALEALRRHPELRLAAIAGGTVDNAIPRECRFSGALPAGSAVEVGPLLEECRRELGRAAENLEIRVAPASLPARVWLRERQSAIVAGLLALPDGVLKMSGRFDGVVETSANLAALAMPAAGRLEINTSQRSLDDRARAEVGRRMVAGLAAFGAEAQIDSDYPAWPPAEASELTRRADAVWEELYGVVPRHEVMHAGLEPACFGALNPGLEMLSAGPAMENPHSPSERVSVAGTERVRRWLYKLVAG